jgi:hypothetical protein
LSVAVCADALEQSRIEDRRKLVAKNRRIIGAFGIIPKQRFLSDSGGAFYNVIRELPAIPSSVRLSAWR